MVPSSLQSRQKREISSGVSSALLETRRFLQIIGKAPFVSIR